MEEVKLKNCPNCGERINKNDIQCPYCKYIDDKRYKKENDKLLNNNKNKKVKKKNKKKELIISLVFVTVLISLTCFILIKLV